MTANFWWIPLLAAFIGAVSALIAPVLKDLIIQRRIERRTKAEAQIEIFRSYAAPLIAASEKLIWRFDEIFTRKRHHFFKTVTLPAVYNDYKRTSTLYRLARALGWIRAIELELDALPRGGSGLGGPAFQAIRQLQGAFADGQHIELLRLEQVSVLWGIDLDHLTEARKGQIAQKFEVAVYACMEQLGSAAEADVQEEKFRVCQELADLLTGATERAKLSEDVVRETMHRALAALSYRQALIYRDWQDAIGDAMLERVSDAARRYRVIGFEPFVAILGGEAVWIKTFRESIDDIDFEAAEPADFRARQLKEVAKAVAKLLIAFSETSEADLVGKSELEAARRLLDALREDTKPGKPAKPRPDSHSRDSAAALVAADHHENMSSNAARLNPSP